MGKGDKRSKKGKIAIGSYGVRRPRPSLQAKAIGAEVPKAKKEKSAAKVSKPAAAKKPAKKKEE